MALTFVTRRAEVSDVDAMAEAHRDSIRSLGPAFYPPDVVVAWQEGISGELYLRAMRGGEVFFVATATAMSAGTVLGFSSEYRIEGTRHGTSVYVRGAAARHGVGSALIQMAEAHAAVRGATSIHIEASLAGVEFYKAHGYTEAARGETPLLSGHAIACVFMQKHLP